MNAENEVAGHLACSGDSKLMPDCPEFEDKEEDSKAQRSIFTPFEPSEMFEEAARRVRWASKKFFMTYPKCPLEKHQLLEAYQEKWGSDLHRWVIAREFHKDGTPHLHALIEFHKVKEFTKADWGDVMGYHGNYATPRQYIGCVSYVCKEDAAVVSNWNVLAYLEKLRKKGRVNYKVINTHLTKRGAKEMVNEGY
jgi:hypothetical protein